MVVSRCGGFLHNLYQKLLHQHVAACHSAKLAETKIMTLRSQSLIWTPLRLWRWPRTNFGTRKPLQSPNCGSDEVRGEKKTKLEQNEKLLDFAKVQRQSIQRVFVVNVGKICSITFLCAIFVPSASYRRASKPFITSHHPLFAHYSPCCWRFRRCGL